MNNNKLTWVKSSCFRQEFARKWRICNVLLLADCMILYIGDVKDTSRKLWGLRSGGRRQNSTVKYQQISYIPTTNMEEDIREQWDGSVGRVLALQAWWLTFDPWNPCKEREEPTHFKELSADLHSIPWHATPTPTSSTHTGFFFNIVLRFHVFLLCVYECLPG